MFIKNLNIAGVIFRLFKFLYNDYLSKFKRFKIKNSDERHLWSVFLMLPKPQIIAIKSAI